MNSRCCETSWKICCTSCKGFILNFIGIPVRGEQSFAHRAIAFGNRASTQRTPTRPLFCEHVNLEISQIRRYIRGSNYFGNYVYQNIKVSELNFLFFVKHLFLCNNLTLICFPSGLLKFFFFQSHSVSFHFSTFVTYILL